MSNHYKATTVSCTTEIFACWHFHFGPKIILETEMLLFGLIYFLQIPSQVGSCFWVCMPLSCYSQKTLKLISSNTTINPRWLTNLKTRLRCLHYWAGSESREMKELVVCIPQRFFKTSYFSVHLLWGIWCHIFKLYFAVVSHMSYPVYNKL